MDSRICKHHTTIGPKAGSGTDAAIVRICKPVINVQLLPGQMSTGVILYPPGQQPILYPGGQISYP